MSPGRSGRSLGERAANSGVRPETVAPREAVPPGAERPSRPGADRNPAAGVGGEGRHCWVRNPPDAPGTWPGLLVEWRQREGQWEGRVIYTVTGASGSAVVETWLAASRLEPR